MTLKEKIKQYKERKEAQNYFRKQNDLYLDTISWIQISISGLITSLLCGICFGFLTSLFHISSSLYYIFSGFIIGNTLVKVSGIQSNQMAITSVCMTYLSFVFKSMIVIVFSYASMGMVLPFSLIFSLFFKCFISLFTGNLFSILMIVLGLFVSYNVAK